GSIGPFMKAAEDVRGERRCPWVQAKCGARLSPRHAPVLETRARDRDPVPRRAGKTAAARPTARAARVRPRARPAALGLFATRAALAAPEAHPRAHRVRALLLSRARRRHRARGTR